MFDVALSLRDAFASAHAQLRSAQANLARANAGGLGRSADVAMAQTAQVAIFTEALLAAVRARFEAIKSVAK
jgi:hypothetical protein